MRNPDVEILGVLLRAGDTDARAKVAAAITRHSGRIADICRELAMPTRTFYHWQTRVAWLSQQVQAARKDHAKPAEPAADGHPANLAESPG